MTPPSTAPPRLGRRSAAIIVLAALVGQAWMLDLPFQLDDFALLPDPWAIFGHVDRLAGADIPPFMCRIPMWLAWAFVHLFATEPLSPVPFHVFGLMLHASAALLLARALARHAPASFAAPAALAGGAGFAIAGGAMQAVSWTAAWSSLIYTLFGLAAVNLALDARARGRWIGTAGAGVCFYLAIITKAPAVVVPATALVLLGLTALAARAWRRLAFEVVAAAVGTGAGIVTRTLFLGSAHLRYEERVTPPLSELPDILRTGFVAFGQALYPWNRDPLFHGDEPLLAHLGLSAPVLAAVVGLSLAALAFALAPRARAAIACLVVVLVPSVATLGVLYEGQTTNVVSREAYLPMAVALAGLGVAVGALFARRRGLGTAAAVVLAVFLADGNRHVAFTERVHGEELRATRLLLDAVADAAERDRPGRMPLVLALTPDAGFAGIPSLGAMIPLSHAPPFTHARRLEIRAFESTAEFREWLSGADIGGRDVRVLAPACDAEWNPLGPDPELSGAENRARRMLRALSPLRPGLLEEDAAVLERVAQGWRADPPLPAHAVGALELALADGAPLRGELLFPPPPPSPGLAPQAPSFAVAIDDRGSPGTRVALETPLALPLRFGEPLSELGWRGAGPPPAPALRALPALPVLEARAPAENATFVTSEVLDLGPRFAVEGLPPPWRRGAFARLELLFEFKGREASVYSDFAASAAGPLEHVPAWIHLEGASPEALPPEASAPWRMLIEERIAAPLAEGELNGATFRWRITLHHAGGAPAARSAFRTARFVLPRPVATSAR